MRRGVAGAAAVDRADGADGALARAERVGAAVRAARRLGVQERGRGLRLLDQLLGRLRQNGRVLRDVGDRLHGLLQVAQLVHHLELLAHHRLQQADERAEPRPLLDHGRT